MKTSEPFVFPLIESKPLGGFLRLLLGAQANSLPTYTLANNITFVPFGITLPSDN
jgi:hypothetical protein